MVILWLTAFGYVALMAYVVLQKEGGATRYWAAAYFAWGLVLTAGYALAVVGVQVLGYGAGVPTAIAYLISVALLGALTFEYVEWNWGWLWLGMALVLAALTLAADFLGLLPVLHRLTWREALSQSRSLMPIAVAGLWAVGGGVNFALAFYVQTRARLPLHANRLLWWLIILPLIATGEAAAVWAPEPYASIGRILRLVGATGIGYAVTTRQLVDVRNLTRAGIGNAVLIAVTAAVSLLGIGIAQYLLVALQGTTAWLAVAGVALLLALVYQGLRSVAEGMVRQTVLRADYDPAAVAAEYAQRIASQLRFEQLAQTAAFALRDSVEASRGGLILLTAEDSFTRADVYAGLGHFPTVSGQFHPQSPALETLRTTRRPLLQFNVDVGREFRDLPQSERAWLGSLRMDVFVPILDGEKLSGMLAVGPRASGDPYRKRELSLMMAIADQTSVALNNARLFADLRALNLEMQELNEDLLATNTRLAEMDRVKSDFITIASHELRTPLTQLRGYADVLDTLSESNILQPKQVGEITRSLLDACDRLDAVIGQMLDASQIDVEAMELKFVDTSLEAVLRLSVDPFAKAIRERKQTLSVQGLRALPSVLADFQRLVQAFRHLVGNAVKYTPDGGTIELSARHLARQGGRPESVEVVIRDTGVGIDPKYHKLVFEKFFRVGDISLHSTSATKFMGAGAGLGLPIAKGVIEGHGGRIWVESPGYDVEKYPGTTVFVVLPVRPPAMMVVGAPLLESEELNLDLAT